MQIRQLEDEVGGQLFTRTSRAVELTEPGRLLLPKARRLLDQADRTLHETRRSVLGEDGSLRIGFAGVAAYSGVLPSDLVAFHDTHPKVEIQLSELDPAAVVSALTSGAIDLGYTPEIDPGLTAELDRVHRKRIAMTAAMRSNHPLAAHQHVTEASLQQETLIVPASRPEDATVVGRIQSSGRILGRVELVPSALGVLALAAAGIGVAVVPADTARLALPGLVFRPLSDAVGLDLVVISRPEETLGTVRAYRRMLDAAQADAHVAAVSVADG
jgi:DNA-binding transcriptional LysR family regulator